MMTLAIVFTAILAVFAAYAVVAPLVLNYGRFGGGLHLTCPERNDGATVQVNAAGAALFSAYGERHLHMRSCNLLKHGEVCDEVCLKSVSV